MQASTMALTLVGGDDVAVNDRDGVGVRGTFGADEGGGALGCGEVDLAAEEGGVLVGEEVGCCGADAPAVEQE